MWELPFLADATEVAGLRRMLRLRLELWGLLDLSEVVELCASELVTNVITHVGPGTPTMLALAQRGARVRIEVQDPDPRTVPVLAHADSEAESGRGMALIDALTDRWGIDLTAQRKVTWCEFYTALGPAHGYALGPRVTRAADVLGLYGSAVKASHGMDLGRLGTTVAEETAIDVITDLLHWLHAHGRDPEEVLDRAQTHFEAESR
ncbi:ATP-binding protein [Streptomyces sp. NPDC003697]